MHSINEDCTYPYPLHPQFSTAVSSLPHPILTPSMMHPPAINNHPAPQHEHHPSKTVDFLSAKKQPAKTHSMWSVTSLSDQSCRGDGSGSAFVFLEDFEGFVEPGDCGVFVLLVPLQFQVVFYPLGYAILS